jgi:hypothetical protein
MTKQCDGKKVHFDISTNLHVFSTPDYEKVVFGMSSLSVCVHVCMYLH